LSTSMEIGVVEAGGRDAQMETILPGL